MSLGGSSIAPVAKDGLVSPNCTRTSFQRFGLRVLALGLVKHRQVTEALSQVGVPWAQSLFPDCQRPPVKGLGFRVLGLMISIAKQNFSVRFTFAASEAP